MKEQYYNNLMERVAKELKLNSVSAMLSLGVSQTGEKITADGINYFDSIKAVNVISHGEVIATYDIESKKLRYYPYVKNIVVVQDLVNFLNNYNGCEMYRLTKKAQKRALALECAKEEIDPCCAMSDYEIAEAAQTMGL